MIPEAFQEQVIKLAHVGHQGEKRTKEIDRENVWFPQMDKKIKDLIDKCTAYQAIGQANESHTDRSASWNSVAIDFYGPIPNTSQCLLICTDLYSKLPETEIVNSTKARTVISRLDSIWAGHGILQKVKFDTGSPYNGTGFKNYTKALGIKWRPSTPLWPQCNANAESVMKAIGTLMQACATEGRPWKQELQRFLLNYRTDPHKTTSVASCKLLYSRKIQGQLPQIT